MIKHKRTHQLKRHGDYWTIARSSCGLEVKRSSTTTSDLEVTCKRCAFEILMIYQNKTNQIKHNIDASSYDNI